MNSSKLDCRTCELAARRRTGTAPLWDCIHRGEHWDVAHAFGTSMPGWLVIVLQRHAEAVDELSDSEAVELGRLVARVSAAIRVVTGCLKTYVIQFAEHPEHPHVHFHIVPRMEDLPEQERSVGIFRHLGVPDAHCVSVERMNQIAGKVRGLLAQ